MTTAHRTVANIYRIHRATRLGGPIEARIVVQPVASRANDDAELLGVVRLRVPSDVALTAVQEMTDDATGRAVPLQPEMWTWALDGESAVVTTPAVIGPYTVTRLWDGHTVSLGAAAILA